MIGNQFGRAVISIVIIIATPCLLLAQSPVSSPAKKYQTFPGKPSKVARILGKLPAIQQHSYRSAILGADWLMKMNRPDGRFVFGYEPSLRVPLSQNNYIPQIAGAYALARAARFFENQKAGAVAKQALLTLLLDTEKVAGSPPSRRTVFPSANVNRVAAAGWLVLAINELPEPGEDLLRHSEELCRFIQSRQCGDGSLCCIDQETPTATPDEKALESGIHAGPALYGLVKSLNHNKADWKAEFVEKACRYYHKNWRENKNTEMVSWHSAAYAAAYLHSPKPSFSNAANEMNDWICTLQYKELDPRHIFWQGGFKTWVNGKAELFAPDIHGALYVEGLANACLVAR